MIWPVERLLASEEGQLKGTDTLVVNELPLAVLCHVT
jgi:hypothetical protein